jgi:hypothetical protein
VAVLAIGSTSYATPFTTGSFAMNAFTNTTTDVDETSVFNLTTPVEPGSPEGDFVGVTLPSPLMSPAAFDFSTGTGFDFSDPTIGSFVASGVIEFQGNIERFAFWAVMGTYTIGSAFDNAGDVLTANMLWSATQVGGPGTSISLSGTFFAPAIDIPVPEPAALSLLGTGLLGIGVGLIRRKRT